MIVYFSILLPLLLCFMNIDSAMSKTFTYFAYGSNLLQQRIHINNPSAIRMGIGRLDNYTLTFEGHSTRWKGAPATICPQTGSHVWGAIWELGSEHLSTLNAQESGYFGFDVNVTTPEGFQKLCRTYQLDQKINLEPIEKLSDAKKPSKAYLDVIKLGARESKLPAEYLSFLNKIPDNGESNVDIIKINNNKC